jgi:hypothetical protein
MPTVKTEAIGLKKRLTAAGVVVLALLPIGFQAGSIAEFLLNGANDKMSGSLIGVDMFLHTLALVISLWMVFTRRLTSTGLVACLWIAQALEFSNFFAGFFHPFLLHFNGYPEWMGYGNDTNQSSQYAKLYTSIPITIALIIVACTKATRSIDRIYTSLIAASVLCTTLLFHWVTVQGVSLNRKTQEVGLRIAAEAPSAFFGPICKELGTQCLSGPVSALPINTGNAEIDKMLADLSRGAKEQTQGFTKGATTGAPVKASNESRLSAAHVVYHRTKAGEYRFVIETNNTIAALQRWQSLYAALAITAHLIWMVGGLYLLFWHKRRMARRQQREIEIHDFVEKRFYEFIQG